MRAQPIKRVMGLRFIKKGDPSGVTVTLVDDLSLMPRKTSWAACLFFFYCQLGLLVGVDWWLRLGVEAAFCRIGLVGHAGVVEWHGIWVTGSVTEI